MGELTVLVVIEQLRPKEAADGVVAMEARYACEALEKAQTSGLSPTHDHSHSLRAPVAIAIARIAQNQVDNPRSLLKRVCDSPAM